MVRELALNFRTEFQGGATIEAQLQILLNVPGVMVLFGPSGSGKTSILRAIAGLDRSARGRIAYDGVAWLDSEHGLFLSPQARRIGFLFQDYALFPHLTVAQNIAYGLRHGGAGEQRRMVSELAGRFQLADLEGRYPHQLSGGQKQRVALARTLAVRPALLLLDEPLSALDTPTRESLRIELRQVLKQLEVPALVVTHDRVEALALGDQVAVIDKGRVAQHGSIAEVFQRPANAAVAGIVSMETLQPGRIVQISEGLATVAVGGVQVIAMTGDLPPGVQDVLVGIRAEDVILQRGTDAPSSARNRFGGRVEALTDQGAFVRVEVDCGFRLAAALTRQACRELELQIGEDVVAHIKAGHIHLIPR